MPSAQNVWWSDGACNVSNPLWIWGIKLSYLIYQRCKWTCSLPDSQTNQKPHQAFTEVTLNALKARQIHESILIIQIVRLIFWPSQAAKRLSLVFPLGHLSTDWTWGRAHMFRGRKQSVRTWSNCGSSPLWRDFTKGFSCKNNRKR